MNTSDHLTPAEAATVTYCAVRSCPLDALLELDDFCDTEGLDEERFDILRRVVEDATGWSLDPAQFWGDAA